MSFITTYSPKGVGRNEDVEFNMETSRGELYIVLDFARTEFANVRFTLQSLLKPMVETLDKLSGLPHGEFVAYLGREINNCVYRLNHNAPSPLYCVAAIGLLQRNRFSFLTYGDARINLYTKDVLFLLNCTNSEMIGIVTGDEQVTGNTLENPEQMGRKLFDKPLMDRVGSVGLTEDDMVLMYSDGIEEVLTPQALLKTIRQSRSTDANKIGAEILEATRSSGDDRTLIVITGPYGDYLDLAFQRSEKAMGPLQQKIEKLEVNEQQIRRDFEALLNRKIDQSYLAEQLNHKVDYSDLIKYIKKELKELKPPGRDNSGQADIKNIVKRLDNLEKWLWPLEDYGNFTKFFHKVITTHPDWWKYITTPVPDDGRKPPLIKEESKGAVASDSSLSPDEPNRFLIRISPYKMSMVDIEEHIDDSRVTLYASDYHESDIKQEAVDKIKQGLVTHRFFDDSTDYLKKHRTTRRKVLELLGRREGTWVMQIGHVILFIVVIPFLILLALNALGWHLFSGQQPPAQASENWKVKGAGKQISITRVDSNGKTPTIDLEVNRDLPSDLTSEQTFKSFDEVRQHVDRMKAATRSSSSEIRSGIPGQGIIEVQESQEVTVKSGEYPDVLAQHYHTTVEKLRQLNPSVNLDKLRVGQRVYVPKQTGQ
jgi:hypothetical protein